MHTYINRWVLFSSALLMGFVSHPDTAQAQNGIAFSPNQVALSSTILNPALQNTKVTVTVNGQPATSLTATRTPATATFLDAIPTVLPNESYLTVTANPAGLQPGTYTGALNVIANGVTATLPVTLTVNGANSITLSTTSLAFNGSTGGTPPPSQTVNVTGTNGIPFSIATASTQNFLTAAQTGTNVPASITVTASPGNLSPGTYTGTVTVSSSQVEPQVINVTLVVSAQPFLVVTPSPISLLYQTGINAPAPSVTSQVLSSGFAIDYTGSVSYSTCPNFFNVVSGLSGTTGGSLTVTANLTAIGTATQCSGSIILTPTTSGTQGAITVPVTFQSSASPLISVMPSFGNFMYSIGGSAPAPQTFRLSYSGSTALNYGLSSTTPWISLPATPAGGFTSNSFTVSLNQSALATLNPGFYQGNIVITALGAGNSPLNLPVNLTISNSALLTVSPSFINFNYQTVATGGQIPSTISFNVASTMSSVPFTISVPTTTTNQFVAVSPLTGTATTSGTPVLVALNQGVLINLAPGVYQNQIQISGGGSVQTVTVNLNVSTTPLVNVSPQQLTFSYAAGGNAPPQQQLTFSSTNGSTLPVTFTSNQPFLQVGGGSVNTPGSISVGVLNNLTIGTYSAQITVVSGTQTIVVPVIINVTSGISLSATPANLAFTQSVGGAAPAAQTVTVATSNSSALAYSVSISSNTSTNFITVNGSTATAQLSAPGTFTVGVNGSQLPAGTYTGSVTITSVGATNSTVTIPVTLTVSAQSLAVTPTALSFNGTIFGAVPATQTINVTSTTGSPVAFTASATTASGGNFLTVTPTSGTTPANVTVSVSTTGLAAGTYTGTVSITPTAAGSAPLTVPVTFIVGAQATPTVALFVNAATAAPGPVAPGELVTLFGTNIGPVSPLQTTLTSSGSVSTNLGGVQVLFDGIASPLVYVSATQINAVVPYEIAGRVTTSVVVNYNGVTTTALPLNVVATAPGIFVGTGGQAAALNQNGTFNTAGTPAPKGSTVVLYATGEGQTSPLGVTGSVTGATLKNPVAPVTVTIGGVPATVAYAGSAPGLVSGVLQLNVTIPTGAPSGAAVPVILTVGTVSSPQTATVAIQ